MRTLCKFLFLFLPLFSFSQSYDSIEAEIIGARPSKYELVFKSRFLLIEALENLDKKAIQKYSSYLIGTHKTNRNPNLGADEIILLYFVNSDFENILSSIKSNPSANYSFTYHLTSDLRIKLVDYLKSNYSYFVSKIFLSNLKEDEKQFLKLYFDFELKNNDFGHDDNVLYTKAANDFIEKFPESSYSYYVRNFILVQKDRKDWQWGINLGLGYGVYSGDLAEKLTSGVNGLLGFDFFYKKWVGTLKLQTSNSEATDSIRGVDLTLTPGQKANYLDFNLSLGYDLLDGEKMSLTPYLGMGLSSLLQRNSGRDKDIPFIYRYSPSLNLGVNYNYFFGEIFPNRDVKWNYNQWLWGVKAGYHMTNLIGFDNKGVLHGFTIGLTFKSNNKQQAKR